MRIRISQAGTGVSVQAKGKHLGKPLSCRRGRREVCREIKLQGCMSHGINNW